MKTQDTEFLARLRAAFEAEAAEHLQTISTGLLDLEKHAATAEAEPLIETIFRAAHSLKGAARAVNLTGVEAVCQALESVFAALKRQSLTFDENLFELLYETVDVLGQLLAADATGSPTETGTQRVMLIRRLEQAAQGTPLPPAPKPPGKLLGVLSSGAEAAQARPALEDKASHGQGANAVEPALASEALAERTETIRIAKARLNALLLQAEELLSVKLGTGQLAAELRELRAQSAEWERQWAQTMPEARRTRRQVRKRSGLVLSLDDAARLLGFLDWNQEYVRTLQQRVAALAQTATREHRATAGMVDNLMAGVRQAVLMPFDALLESFPKLARDLARSQDKAVELVIEGGQIEIDRRLLEALKDPLIHLVRNSIDHGLEAPPERLAKGKPERGTITIAAEQRGSNRLTVTLSDDGAGIQLARVRQAAVKAGLLAREEAELDAQAVFDLISHSGLTTSPVVTELSGRGLGLAILRERVEQLGGTVELETQPEVGTTFRLWLPLTLATFRGVLLKCGGQTFVMPTTAIERVVRIRTADIQLLEGRPVMHYAGRPLALARLSEALELTAPAPFNATAGNGFLQALILHAAGGQVALSVDEVLSEQEVIVKSLGTQLARVRNIAGATVLASGQVVLILNAADLLKAVLKAPGQAVVQMGDPAASAPPAARILVAEDSVTSRALLRGILENAGYQVKTAVDGLAAWSLLKREPFDLLVSDVEMPRLNGFDLTAQLREDDRLKDLPVVLVTALASDEDRRRGVDVGANAYVVKSNFDQSNLLSVIGRLL